MSLMFNMDNSLVDQYLERLKSRIFKILPLIEEKNDGIYSYVDSLIFELNGLQYVVKGLNDSANYITILSTLESISDELVMKEKDFKFLRSEILRLVSIVNKLQKGD